MSNKTRKAYAAEEKVTILRRHLIDQVPILPIPGCGQPWHDPVTGRVTEKSWLILASQDG